MASTEVQVSCIVAQIATASKNGSYEPARHSVLEKSHIDSPGEGG
jgi:hypothetical protein